MSSNTSVCLPCYADHFPFACTFESSGCLVTGQILTQWGLGGPEGSLVTTQLVAQESALGGRVLGSVPKRDCLSVLSEGPTQYHLLSE